MNEHDDLTADTTEPEPEHRDAGPGERQTLHRSASRRVFGGVCGGLGERFDIDANIVRVVFVVLAVVYGLGVVVYLAMWALIPRAASAGDEELTSNEEPARSGRWLRYVTPLSVLVLLVIIFVGVSHRHQWGSGVSVAGLRFDKGLIVLWLVFLLFLAVISLRSPHRAFSFGRFLAWTVLSVTSFVILLLGAILIVVQVIGVPLEGGSGVKEWAPNSVAQLQHAYHGAFGVSTVDLTQVPFAGGTFSITATEGVGELIVDVPPDVVLGLRTHVGIGTVVTNCGLMGAAPAATHHLVTRLDLNLQVGVGKIELHPEVSCRP